VTPAPRWTAANRFFEYSLLGMLLSGYLAVAGSGYLDLPTAVLAALGLLARAFMVAGWLNWDLPQRRVTQLTLVYICFYPADWLYLSLDFLTATVHLVFFLAIVKTLTAATDRDYLYLKTIAFLQLLAASILSSSANYFLFLALFLLFGAATFAGSEIRRSANHSPVVVRTGQKGFGPRLAGLTVFTFAGILVLAGSLFFLLPRTARAAFQRFIPQRYYLPGFSGEVTLGQIGELKMRNTPVMHVRLSEEARPMYLKWRGAALTLFDGKRWYNPANGSEMLRVERGVLRLAPIEQQLLRGRRISYEIVMQEATSDALFFAGIPESIRIFVPLLLRTPSETYRLGFGATDRLRYSASSLLETDGDPRYKGAELAPAFRGANLRLPEMDPRTVSLARDLTEHYLTDSDRARRLESWLRESFGYTAELPQQEVSDPIADFLFHRKMGHCEYFASSLAVMLRSIGIPARVITGFQSGVYNPVSGWYLIRASDAHSWVEAWLGGKGWTTLDPTPPDPNPVGVSYWSRVQFYVDALEVFWQDWVLGYDLDRQFSLVARLEESTHKLRFRWMERLTALSLDAGGLGLSDWKKHAKWLAAGLAIAALVLLVAPFLRNRWSAAERVRRVQRGLASSSDATLLYRRMLAVLRRRGIEKPAWLTPSEFARIVPDPRYASLIAEFTVAYNDLRFGLRTDAAIRMVDLLDELEHGGVAKAPS